MRSDVIDMHVFWGEWPFSNTGFWDGARLRERLEKAGIARAFVSPFGHALCKDEFELDRRFLADLRGNDFLLPVAGLNLKEAYWPERMARLGTAQKFAGLILHPATRHFRLDDQSLVAAFFQCRRKSNIRGPVFVSAGIEEQRMRPLALDARPVGAPELKHVDPLLRNRAAGAAGEDENELAAFIRLAPPDIPIIILGLSASEIGNLIKSGNLEGKRILFDSANLDVGPLERWRELEERHYCFGSFCPVLAPEGAVWTLEFSAAPEQRHAIYARGAEFIPDCL